MDRLFRIAFDDRIGRLPDSLVLPVKAHLQVVIFHDTLHVPLTHQGDAVLGVVTVHNRHTQAFAVMHRAFSRVERLLTRNYGYQPKTDRQDRKEAPNAES